MDNYSFIILGPSGSGKSVFLASFYKILSTSRKLGFSLDVQDSTKRKSLNKIYADLITGEDWPAGTRNISEWVFTCYVNTPKLAKIPACKLTYVDYAGGIITDVSTDERNYSDYSDLESYLTISDSVLAILDGQKLLLSMQDQDNSSNKSVWQWRTKDLPNLMQMIDQCSKDIPVNFIISKWDLLQSKYSLADVTNCLIEKVPEFRDVVDTRIKARCPMHLIPVSSIGNNFAILQSDGSMKKNIGKIPQPMNVEVPLAFALTDKLNHQTNRSRLKFGKCTLWDLLILGIGTLIMAVTRDISLAIIILAIMIIYFLVRLLIKNKVNNKKAPSKTFLNEKAFKEIMSKCQKTKKQFTTKFPDSDLAKNPLFKSR